MEANAVDKNWLRWSKTKGFICAHRIYVRGRLRFRRGGKLWENFVEGGLNKQRTVFTEMGWSACCAVESAALLVRHESGASSTSPPINDEVTREIKELHIPHCKPWAWRIASTENKGGWVTYIREGRTGCHSFLAVSLQVRSWRVGIRHHWVFQLSDCEVGAGSPCHLVYLPWMM